MLAFIIGSIGLGLMIAVDWRIALGVFLLMWCNNIEYSYRRR